MAIGSILMSVAGRIDHHYVTEKLVTQLNEYMPGVADTEQEYCERAWSMQDETRNIIKSISL